MTAVSYDTVPYEAGAFGATAPHSMAFVSLANGGPTPGLGPGTRVLELGCGDGRNLLPLAYHHPDWTLVGMDLSKRAIERAEAGRAELGLENVRFVRGDVADFQVEERYEYILAHGLYSWIPEAARDATRKLMADALSADGLAYVSFNSQPAWGVRGRVRDALIRTDERSLERARALASGLSSLIEEPSNFWEQLIAHELSRARIATDSYLAHEYLAPDNDPFWLGDVIDDFQAAGLSYAGDALFDRVEGWVPPTRRAAAAELTDDPIRREELIDLLHYRQLRGALFSRQPASAPKRVELVDHCLIAGVVACRSDPFNLERGVPEGFDGPRGGAIVVDRPLSKMALLLLADRYPQGSSLEDLVERSTAQLEAYGIASEPGDVGVLRDNLYELFDHLELELRLYQPRLRTEPGERPTVDRFARWEASLGNVLTTGLHSGVPLEPIDRAIVARLDGTRSTGEVAQAIAEAVNDDELELEGAPSGLARLTPIVEARVSTLVTTLSWWGLVE